MEFGAIIKRAWHITWRYKALWVLGIFAGVSGCQGGSPGSSSGGRGSDSSYSRFGDIASSGGWNHAYRQFLQYVPALIALGVALLALWIVWSVLSVAARGGLIVAVNEIEEGRELRLGELWKRGFAKFWPLVGLGLLLNLPLAIVALVFAFAVALPLVGAAFSGRDASTVVAPLCGSLVIGIPLLIVLSFVLGIMYLVASRYLVLGDQGAVEAAGNAWRFFRNRFKDSALFYLLSGVLNMVASAVLAIPIIAIVVAFVVPFVVAGRTPDIGAVLAAVAGAIALMTLVGLFYSAVWGTFTSSLWTLFFRRVTGLERPAMPPQPYYPQPSSYPTQPPVAPDGYPPPPVPPHPAAPEAAGYPQPPQPPAPPQPPVSPGPQPAQPPRDLDA